MSGFDSGLPRRGNLTYLPVVPGRLEFAALVRQYITDHKPQVIAVELPESLEAVYRVALDRMPRMSVVVIPDRDDDESATYLPVEPGDPFVEALRSAREIDATTMLLEPARAHKPLLPALYPDPYTAALIGPERYIDLYRLHPPERSEDVTRHAAAMAWKLQGADPLASTVVVVALNLVDALLEAMETPQDEPEGARMRHFGKPEVFNLHPDCLAEVTSEPPYYQELYEKVRSGDISGIDRPRWQLSLTRDAEKEYQINTGDKISSWQRRGLAKFSRNLAMLDGQLVPGLFDLTLAARSIVDDNYAYELWEMANRFNPQQTEDLPLETLNLSGRDVWLRTRRLRLRRRLPRMKQMLRPSRLQKRKKEQREGEWASQTNGTSICSYPPEDFVIEDYGRFLKRYAKSVVSEERARVEPFRTSMLDGIDLRETVRNWSQGQLYVREEGKFAGDMGALVVIFDDDRDNRYNYLTTWLGEHQNESDMAFYSTDPFANIVGPGIGRAEYGGLLMTLPPRRMMDVWSDPDYELAESKGERLLMAALDYSVERHVLYVAAKPPRSMFRQLAARLNRKIVYVPLGQLSPVKLKKVRVVHVLDSYARRAEAKGYIW